MSIEQAIIDGAAVLAARERAQGTGAACDRAGAFRRHAADRSLAAAEQERGEAENAVRERWGSAPQNPEGVPT